MSELNFELVINFFKKNTTINNMQL